jgi:hypothetical protein
MSSNEQDKARAYRLIMASIEEDRLEEELSQSAPELSDRARASLEHSCQMVEDMKKAAAFRAIVEQAKEDEVEAEEPGELSAAAKASLERTAKMFEKAPAAAPSDVIDIRRVRSRIIAWCGVTAIGAMSTLAAGFTLFTHAAGLQIARNEDVHTVATTPVTASGIPYSEAQLIELEGTSYCAAHLYTECLQSLDRALTIDPAAENAWPRIATARRFAVEELSKQKGGH